MRFRIFILAMFNSWLGAMWMSVEECSGVPTPPWLNSFFLLLSFLQLTIINGQNQLVSHDLSPGQMCICSTPVETFTLHGSLTSARTSRLSMAPAAMEKCQYATNLACIKWQTTVKPLMENKPMLYFKIILLLTLSTSTLLCWKSW